MLATTIQITNNPPHTTHTNNTTTASWLRRQPPPTGGGRSHGVEREPDSVSARITFYAQPKNAPTPTTHNPGSKHMQAQENNQHTNQTANMLLAPPKRAP